MNPEKQRIAIAKAVGWKIIHGVDKGSLWRWITVDPNGHTLHSETLSQLPDYLNSLDAMHEAEKRFTEEQLQLYCIKIGCGIGTPKAPVQQKLVRATAAQRAEAFLKTLGLWTEEE